VGDKEAAATIAVKANFVKSIREVHTCIDMISPSLPTVGDNRATTKTTYWNYHIITHL
jgi:hypothetical protein